MSPSPIEPENAPRLSNGPARPLIELHRSEDGMIALTSLITILFMVILIGLVGNIGYTIIRKMEVQNSADAVAYTAAIWQARGMNTITATNHLMGEMQSLVVLHDAIGGEELENKPSLDPDAGQAQSDLNTASSELTAAWTILYATGEPTPAYASEADLKVGEQVKSGATIRASMTNLKKALTAVYITRIGAKALEETPAAAVGAAIDLVALGIEAMILAEYTALKFMENLARETIPIRDMLFTQMLPNASDFEGQVVESIPHFSAEAAQAIAQKNKTTGAIYPAEPQLPVLRDHQRGQTMEDSAISRSALVRATYPWVKYDRAPILDMTSWMIFSQTRKNYIKYTDLYTILKSKELYNKSDRDFSMYVMTKPGETKGSEPWTNDSHLANKMFTVVGFAHQRARTAFGPRVFRVPNSDGMVGCAQAIVYNANSQNPGNGSGGFQPEVGWDTLNWEPSVSSSGAYEHKEGPEEVHEPPHIKLNWQAKLVPVTRLGEAIRSGEVASPVQKVIDRLGENPDRLLTH